MKISLESLSGVTKILPFVSVSSLLLFQLPSLSATLSEISFTESRTEFEWKIRWNGTIPAIFEDVYASRKNFWTNGINNVGAEFTILESVFDKDQTFDNIIITIQHKEGPHLAGDNIPGFDINPGNPILEVSNPPIKLGDLVEANNQRLATFEVTHRHTPQPDHQDIYELFYTRVATGTGAIDFTITGVHTEPKETPEPLTMIASGLALGFGSLCQKEYAKKRKKS